MDDYDNCLLHTNPVLYVIAQFFSRTQQRAAVITLLASRLVACKYPIEQI